MYLQSGAIPPWGVQTFICCITYLQLKQSHHWLECKPHLEQLLTTTLKKKNCDIGPNEGHF